MKITFIEPPPLGGRIPERFAGCSYELYHFPDLANLYPSACLHREGYQVGYIDGVLEGLSEEAFLERIEKDDSAYYGMHSVILAKRTDLHYINAIRKLKPDVRLILHGPEPTRVPEEYIEQGGPNVLVFRGEIENNLISYLRDGKLNGVSLLEDKGMVHHPPSPKPMDINALPFPLRSHEALRPYLGHYFNPKFSKKPYTVMMASRGCSFNCLFCVPNSISFAKELEYRRYFGRKPKPTIARSARVIEEFRRIKEEGFRAVMVVDDQFLWGRRRTLEICAGIKGLGVEWGCLSRADFLTDEEVVQALAEAGCVSVDIGAESLSQEVLDDIRKDLRVEDIHRAMELLNRYGIRPKLNLMLGTSSKETAEGIQTMVNALREMDVENVMFSIATPFKGTEFYELSKKRGILVDDSDEINPLGKSVISYPHLSGETLEKLERYAYRSFYLRPGMIGKQIKRALRGGNLLSALKVMAKLLR